MALVLAGQLMDFFTKVNSGILYGIAFGVLAVFIVYTFVGSKKTDTIKKQ